MTDEVEPTVTNTAAVDPPADHPKPERVADPQWVVKPTPVTGSASVAEPTPVAGAASVVEPQRVADPASVREPESGAEPEPAPARQRRAGRDEPPRTSDDRDEDEPRIAPGSLRVDARVAEELFGTFFAGIAAHGPTAFGNHNTINNNNFAPQHLDPIISPLTDVAELLECYTGTPADDPLDDILARRSIACLTGPKNSGRFSTGCAALARRYSAEAVHEISLPAGTPPEALLTRAEEIRAGQGYLLRLSGRGHVETMRELAGLFHRRSATLLLIRDEGAREREPHRAEVRHQRPDPIMVFRGHLVQRLRRLHDMPSELSARETDRYLAHEDLRRELEQIHSPTEVVAVARVVGQRHPLDDDARRAILSASGPRRRRRASRILLPNEDDAPAQGRRTRQYERAFRISYAVFHRQPLHYAFDAAAWLLAEIDKAALRPEWGRMALEHPVRELLGEELRDDWDEGRGIGTSRSAASRSAWIRDAGLRGAILDVAWHDFDSTREPLRGWVDRLVREGDETMVRAAAETAALLAHHDFEQVHEKLIDDWAVSPSRRVRQAAAWTVTITDLGGRVGPLIRRKLRDWCYGDSNYRRDTAARVYASGLRQRVLAWSMSDLQRIAADRMQRSKHSVAEAVNQLYEPGNAAWLVSELVHWLADRDVRVHAARALLALAARPAAESAAGSPELLVRLAAGEVDNAELARIWRVALVEPRLAPSPWPVFAGWLRHADHDETLRKYVAELLGTVANSAYLGRRMSFFLARTAEFKDGVPLWVREPLENR